MSETAVSEICNQVMRGVVAMICNGNLAVKDYDAASTIIKSEVKAFLFGDEYLDERICLIRQTVHQNVILASVILSAFNKIRTL